jgi:hypothetical protein
MREDGKAYSYELEELAAFFGVAKGDRQGAR